ncbi:MAG: ABC transporter ATP-binding protein [Actinomycetota bacterium]|nr:ABC transporter ATP-binding protein [Actinomycetota bacterium]
MSDDRDRDHDHDHHDHDAHGTQPSRPPTSTAELRGGRMSTIGVPTEKSKDFKAAVRRLADRLGPERVRVGTVLVLAVASVTLVVIGPKVLGHATNIIFDGIRRRAAGGPGIDFGALHATLWVAVALYLGSYVLAYLQAFLLAGVVQRTMFQLRADVEAKLHAMPLSYLDRQARGDLLSRVTNDIDNVSQSLQQSISQLLTGVLTIVGTVAMMIWISWELAIVAVVSVPVSIFTLQRIAKHSKGRFIAQWQHTGALNAQVEETFTGHTIVKAFGRDREAQASFDDTNEQLYTAGFGAQFISGCVQPATVLIGNLNYVAIAVLGGLKVANRSMGLGDVQAFIQYSRQFSQPLTSTASMINVLQSGIASAERVFELLDAPEQSADADVHAAGSPAGGGPAAVQGRVEFHDVSFSYRADTPLIEHLSLVAEPGQTVAIVGPTGAGKTTLVNLIMRFYELNDGYITLDGRDITTMPRSQLRREMGMVLQDTWLFGGTIRENIAYGNTDATPEQVLAAAKACYVDRFVHSLPHGYDTVLDDDGTTVSAGEKQLLTIARAFLADPSILILDEATSSVDTRTEVLIQHAMAKLRGGRTSFVIAHRLSTIRDADTILVMDAGRIVEQGSHSELLAHGGAYFTLYNAQFTGAATEVA